jgi:hypothetical protein
VVGVRVFVASEAEQRAVEQAIAAIARQEQDTQAHLTAATPWDAFTSSHSKS